MCGGGGNQTFTIIFTATKENQFPPVINDGANISNPGSDDNFVTDVTLGSTIIFRAGGDITSIDGITVEAGGNVFSDGPKKQDDGTWQGTIENSSSVLESGYSLTYTIAGEQYTQDPKLRIKQ
jgi:hypothetical protein